MKYLHQTNTLMMFLSLYTFSMYTMDQEDEYQNTFQDYPFDTESELKLFVDMGRKFKSLPAFDPNVASKSKRPKSTTEPVHRTLAVPEDNPSSTINHGEHNHHTEKLVH